MEGELRALQTQLSQAEASSRTKDDRLSLLQTDLTKAHNEKLALERRTEQEISRLTSALEDCEEELQSLRDGEGSAGRERELLARIDEDEAKISALQLLVTDDSDTKKVREQLRRTQAQLVADAKRLEELTEEKEAMLYDLEEAHSHIASLTVTIQDRDACVSTLRR